MKPCLKYSEHYAFLYVDCIHTHSIADTVGWCLFCIGDEIRLQCIVIFSICHHEAQRWSAQLYTCIRVHVQYMYSTCNYLKWYIM